MSVKTPGVNQAGSPSAIQDDELDEDGGQPAPAEADPPPADDVDPDPSPEPAKPGDGKADEPTPLDKLRGKLTGEPAKPDAEPEGDQPADADPADADPAAEVDEGEQPGETDADNDKPEEGPFKGFTPAERNNLGRKASKRIVELNTETKTLRDELSKSKPIMDAGRFLERARADQGLEPDEVIAALVLQGAYKRADPKALEALESAADSLREDLRMPARVPAVQSIEPYVGALPQEFQDMVDSLGMPEARVRLLAGAEKAQRDAETAKAKAKADPPPQRQPEQRAPQRQPQTTVPLTPAGFPVHEAQLADDAVADFLASQGVKPEQMSAHMERLRPLMAQRAPVNPTTGKPDHRFIAPVDRLKAVQIAQQRHVIAEAKRKADARRAAPPASSGAAPAPGRSSASASSMTPLEQLRRKTVAGAGARR